jgi:hypothetical protein
MNTINMCLCRTVLLTLTVFANSTLAEDTLFRTPIDAKSIAPLRVAQQNKSTAEMWGYQINGNALRLDTKKLILTIKPGLTVTASVDKVELTGSGGLLWQGRIDRRGAIPGKHLMEVDKLPGANYVTLVRRGLQINGTVTVDGQLYRVHPLSDGKHLIIQADLNQKFEEPLENSVLPSTSKPLQRPKVALPLPPIFFDPLPVVRVFVAYTPAAAAEAGNIHNLIDVAVAQTNQSFIDSKIAASIEFAGSAKANYKESGSVETDLSRLTGTNDKYMDAIHGIRDERLADVVVLLTSNANYQYGGIAKIAAEADTAFAIVGVHVATDEYAFGHELGHLFGARHDVSWDPTTTPFAYGHGYVASDSSFRTIMAYDCDYFRCPVVNYWSNPDVKYYGLSMGTHQTANNARVLNERAAYVASFRGGNTDPGIKEWEYNDTPWYSIPVYHLDSIVRGVISTNKDTDYIGVYVPPGATLGARLIPGYQSDFDVYIYDKDGATVLASSTQATGKPDIASVKNTGTEIEIRFVQVKYFSGATGSVNGKYSVRLSRY